MYTDPKQQLWIDLPKSWGNVSQFNQLPDTELARYGWRRVPEIVFDPDLQHIKGWSFDTKEPQPVVVWRDLQTVREVAERRIRAAFERESTFAVPAAGTTWNGGLDSAISLDGARRMALEAGATTVTLYDTHNEPHELDASAAANVVLAVGAAYQAAFAAKQAKMRAVREATTPENIVAVINS